MMEFCFIADPLESFKIYKDTTFAMMREAQRRGHTVAACEPPTCCGSAGRVQAVVRAITLTGDADTGLPRRGACTPVPLNDFDAIVMRKDPPFDSEYFYATHLLEQAEREARGCSTTPGAARPPGKAGDHGVPAVHRPHAGHARRRPTCKRFHAEHRDIILKPLDGMGGMGIFRVGPMA
jgi:glutathione synthase